MEYGLMGMGLKQLGVDVPNLGASGLVGGAINSLGIAKDDTINKFGEVRKAGAILSGNPAAALALDLVFPSPMAHGTIDAEKKRGGFR